MKLLTAALLATILPFDAFAASPREELKTLTAELQTAPSDDALRARIIKIALKLKPAPALPEEAERRMAYGKAAFQGAKSPADFKDAADEFESAILAAPWSGNAYFNLAVAQDKTGNYVAALRNLTLARLALPDDKDVKALLYQVEYRNKKTVAGPKSGETFRDCPECPEMVALPADAVGRSVAVGKMEVSQAQWLAIMGGNPSVRTDCGADCPVEQISWYDAKEFISRLNSKTGKQYRLPSEAEWGYACHAGGQQRFCGGDGVDGVAWYYSNSGSGKYSVTSHPGGRKQPNSFGLYDMSGNVWEWVEDCDSADCTKRAVRGGSFRSEASDAAADYRFSISPATKGFDIGFRLARTLP